MVFGLSWWRDFFLGGGGTLVGIVKVWSSDMWFIWDSHELNVVGELFFLPQVMPH